MAKKLQILNIDMKKIKDGMDVIVDGCKAIVKKHGGKFVAVGLVGVSLDNLRLRVDIKKERKENIENTVKAQQVVCKMQTVLEAEVEEKEKVLEMNEKLREALIDKMEEHKDEEG